MNQLKILLFAKNNHWGDLAVSFLQLTCLKIIVYRGDHGDPFPEISEKEFDYIVSFSCPWVLPENLLKQAKISAINFHPGSPDYPGIGCTNFALYNKETKFGVVCHHMLPTVDSGCIIATKYFPILKGDTVYALTERTYYYMITLFIEIMDMLLNHKKLPASYEKWRREPFTRKELNELCEVRCCMSQEEITKRIQAVTFPGKPGAYINLFGYKFILDNNND